MAPWLYPIYYFSGKAAAESAKIKERSTRNTHSEVPNDKEHTTGLGAVMTK